MPGPVGAVMADGGGFAVPKRSGMLVMMLMALLLAACGSDGGDEEPTTAATEPPAATEAPVATPTRAPTEVASPTAATPALVASPAVATPVSIGTPIVAASPVVEAPGIVPVIDAIASPVGSPEVAPAASPIATPQASPAATVFLAGRVVLPGNANEAYVLTDEGCVGLGADADLRAGRQVIVRDERGTIIGVTTLEASTRQDACAWSFTLEVPASAFYEVAIPMKTAMVFTHEEIARNDGEIELRVR